MPIELPKTIQSHDEVAENLRPLYVAVDGQPGLHFKDISGLQTAFVKQKETNQTLTAQITQLTEATKAFEGLDIVKVRDLMSKEDEIKKAAASQPAEIQQFKTQLEQTYMGKVSAAEQRANSLKSLIEGDTKGNAIRSQLTAAGARADRLDALVTLIEPKIGVAWDPNTGKPRPAVLKADGMPILNPATGDEMTVADVVSQYRKDYPELFQAQAGNGTGATGGETAAPTDGDPLKWTMEQQRAYAKIHGEAALQQRIIEAGKARKPAKVA